MGQVYRATDAKLGRQVAIKILPDAVAADPERLARFEREAKTLASQVGIILGTAAYILAGTAAGASPAAASVLRRCLEKDPARRLRDIREARLQIEQAIKDPAPPALAPAARQVRNRERRLWAVAVVASVIVSSAIAYVLRPAAVVTNSVRFEIPVGVMRMPSRSPCRRTVNRVAYAAVGTTGAPMVFVRRLNAIESRAIPGTEGANQVTTCRGPSWPMVSGSWSPEAASADSRTTPITSL